MPEMGQTRKSGGTAGEEARPQSAQMGTASLAHDQRNSVAYLRAISLIWSLVSCFRGTPGGLQVSRKKPSRPGGATIQSSRNSCSGLANQCKGFLGMYIVLPFSNGWGC